MSNITDENTKDAEWQVQTSKSGRTFHFIQQKEKEIPAISVIVPVFNAGYTLAQALDSLADQSFDNIEIVCVDDKSTDDSRQIIDGFAARHGNVTIVEHTENAGYGAAMNDGISVASGKWIAILEPDDYIRENMYQEMMRAIGACSCSKVDVVKTPYIREVREEGVKRGDAAKELLNCSYNKRIQPKTQPFAMTDPSANHLLRHHPSIWSAIYRKDFLNDNGIDFVEYPGAGWADNEFFYKTLLGAENIIYVDDAFYVYREETDEEYNSFARKNKTLPFERWQSMTDIISDLGLDDNENIVRSHISKGFTYLSGELQANGEDDEVVNDEMRKMFARMDADLVNKESKINPHLKDKFFAYCQYQDDDRQRVERSSNAAYYAGLVGEFFYTVRNNGIGFAMQQVKKILH